MAAGGGSNGGALPPWRRRAPRTPETVRESRDMARGGQKKTVYLGKKNCVNININIYIYILKLLQTPFGTSLEPKNGF